MSPPVSGRPRTDGWLVPRLLLGVVGLAAATYGGWLLWEQRGDATSLGLWLAGGVLLHDGVLSPLLVAGGLVLARFVPEQWRVPVVVAVVVWGSITLLAIPVLGEFGALPDNPTLLDRPYLTTWAVLTAVLAAGVVAAALVVRRRAERKPRRVGS